MDGGADERLGSTENHVNMSACGNVGGKGRVVGGDRVDGVGGVSRKGVMGKIQLENSRKIWGTALYNLGCHLECCQENNI